MSGLSPDDGDQSTTAVASVRTRLLDALDSADSGHAATAMLAVVAAAVAVLVSTGVFPFRSLNHDEGVYLQQAELLLAGKVFLSPPVEDAFRPWFFVESDRGLYSKYAPVPATVFALGKLLGGYTVALVGIAAGLVVATVSLGRELFDARVGVLAGVLLLATPLFVVHSGVYLPYALTATLNVAFAVWYLRGERRESLRDATLAGVAVGLAFFARPYTAVLFALPFVAHAVVTLLRARAWRVLTAGRDAVDTAVTNLLARRVVTAALGLAGVAAALGYNVVVTGDPLVFPYLAFAPEDGIGFGERAILGHEVDYTVELALEANRLVVTDLLTEWVVAGTAGAVAAGVGVAVAVGRARAVTDVADGVSTRVRRGLLAGTFLTVVGGNVAFWGNYNVLGALDASDDGLIHYLGPYYHYDLIVPTAVFAAVAVVAGVEAVRRHGRRVAERDGVDPRAIRAVGAALLLVAAAGVGGVGVAAVDETVDRNQEVTQELRAGYGPLADGGPEDGVVFLPTPYGPWLNHPFQLLVNDADYDDGPVYALGDTHELAVAAAFPDRDLYRYVYAGSWVPVDDSTVRGAVKEVERISGESISLTATLGRPDGVEATTVRITGDEGSTYLVANDSGGPLTLHLTVDGDTLRASGDALASPSGDATLAVDDVDEVSIEVFVATGPASGYSYQVVFPVEREDGIVRALSPTVERCSVPTQCIPQGIGETPPNRGVDVTLSNAST
ncbi:ArnT family glycosyltransferase [Halobaculum limi]|uniref:ArnT family glycosyltransferase n=1 Tax=Halobaculum limi TaxID=3031916 RepID=UPI002406E019|nr:glycosyltransferase family 39 protein [Halobaculum sp. YSMS11]